MLVMLDVLEGRHKKAQRHKKHTFSKVFPKRPPLGDTFEIACQTRLCAFFVPFSLSPLTPPCFSLLNLNFAFGFDSKSRVKHHTYIYDTYLERPSKKNTHTRALTHCKLTDEIMSEFSVPVSLSL